MTVKAPEETRAAILRAAFEEMHKLGYRGASIQRIVEKAGITKGALFHHFKDKQHLGYAVVEEYIYGIFSEEFIRPLEGDDPVEGIIQLLQRQNERCCECPDLVQRGCPLNNLAQEMSFEDEGFRERIERIYALWRQAIAAAFERGVANKKVRSDIDPAEVASFIVAVFVGTISTTKCACDPEVAQRIGNQLTLYLHSIRN